MSQRPTLLIGYGRFGREVLSRFLDSTASRGLLAWEAPKEPGKSRRLRDLSLLWLRDPNEPAGPGDGVAEGGHSAELMRDLDQQIVAVVAEDLGREMEKGARSMLDAANRARQDKSPLGLDAIVLAQPRETRSFGNLLPSLENGIDHLYNVFPQLRREVGADALNFLQILDFENYWAHSPMGKAVREQLKSYVGSWQRRRSDGRPGFARIYLVDGETSNGTRKDSLRINEICLFLEFLLFEGQRDTADMQKIYQASSNDEPLIATFGIRLQERSTGLLKRLAAAWFGVGWLEYLANGIGQDANLRPLVQLLDTYQGPELEDTLRDDDLPVLAQESWAALAAELEPLPKASQDWAQQVCACYERGIRQIEHGLVCQVQAHIQQTLEGGSLEQLSANVCEAIEATLHNERRPATLAAVRRELEKAIAAIDPPLAEDAASSPLASGSAMLHAVQGRHSAFQWFCSQRLKVADMDKWWPFFTVAMGLGLSPLLSGWMATLGAATSGSPPSGQPWLPTLSAFAVGGLTAWVLRLGVKRNVLRASRFWTDPERGRLTESLRALMEASDYAQNALVKRLQCDAILNIRGEMTRELRKTLKRLDARRHEIDWLRSQLCEFLALHGLNPARSNEHWNPTSSQDYGIRHAMESFEDFKRILNTNPPQEPRFQSMQAEKKPFKQWQERYSPAFLYPLRFIDELSEEFKDPVEQELAQFASPELDTRTKELRDFLDRHSSDFGTAFLWKAREGVPMDTVYCLLPAQWRQVQRIRDTLTGQAISEQNRLEGMDPNRVYLLRLKLGVQTACLLD
jgi:hypothetical protein